MKLIFSRWKHIILFTMLLFSMNVVAQIDIRNLKLESDGLYLFCRGTKAKSGLIAEKFNVADRNITHVGIGYFENEQLRIYNVTDVDTSKTALVIDDLDSFLSGAYYMSVWKCNVSPKEYLKLKEICSSVSKNKVYFDFSFELKETDSALYCSEFCALVLKSINPKRFDFKPKIIKLESYYQALLQRKKLIYFPVDFFEESDHFTKIFETYLKQRS